jgi:hypothetical protein
MLHPTGLLLLYCMQQTGHLHSQTVAYRAQKGKQHDVGANSASAIERQWDSNM